MKKDCLDYAMDYIYHYPKTERDLKIQLLKKGYSEEDIENTLRFLKGKNFVGDELFVQMYFSSEIIKKGKPYNVVKNKLIQKGVDKKIINDVFSKMEDEMSNGIQNKISKEIEKYKNKGMDGFDIMQKLASKGYSIRDIKKVVQNLTKK